MNRLKVSVSRMESDVKALRGEVKKLESDVKALESTMLSLSSCWEGPSWEVFKQAVANDTVYMNQLISYLNNYADRLESASKQYLNGEQDAAMKAKMIIVL